MRKTSRSNKLESANLIAAKLSALLAHDSEEIPAGFKSGDELAELVGRSAHSFKEKLNALARAGKIEKRKILIQCDGGRRLAAFYKV